MKDLKYYDIKFLQLRIFCDAAKYESFTKAADRLYTTQSVVSKAVSNLESELGFQLFLRSARKVTLTPSGKIFYEYCLKVFSLTEDYISKAENLIDKRKNSLVIGYDKTTRNDIYLFPIVEQFNKRFPDVQIEIELLDIGPSIEGVSSGAFDVCFTMLCNTQSFSDTSIEWKIIKECKHIAFVPRKLFKFTGTEVTPNDILSLPLIITCPPANIDYYNKTMGIYYQYGIRPNIKSLVASNSTMLFYLHKGDGMVITNEFMETNNDPSIIHFALEDTKDALVAFFRRNDSNPLTNAFIQIAYETMNR